GPLLALSRVAVRRWAEDRRRAEGVGAQREPRSGRLRPLHRGRLGADGDRGGSRGREAPRGEDDTNVLRQRTGTGGPANAGSVRGGDSQCAPANIADKVRPSCVTLESRFSSA